MSRKVHIYIYIHKLAAEKECMLTCTLNHFLREWAPSKSALLPVEKFKHSSTKAPRNRKHAPTTRAPTFNIFLISTWRAFEIVLGLKIF